MKKNILFYRTKFTLITLFFLYISSSLIADTQDNLPSLPYGTPITYQQVMQIVSKVHSEAEKRGVSENSTFVIVDNYGEIFYIEKASNATNAEIDIAILKARASARYKTTTRWFRDQLQEGNLAQSLALPGSAGMGSGGTPIVVRGKIIGAIAVSGATAMIDARVAEEAIAEIE